MSGSFAAGHGLRFALVAGVAFFAAAPLRSPAAQTAAQDESGFLIESVTVTARKRTQAEEVQDVPVSVTAFGSKQLEEQFVTDLAGLSYAVPNVSLEDIGTQKGTANFSIRGLGVNSSIPSIDPTVGVFVDGVYLGINHGVIFDMFDLEGVEVLRGPQGVLFGRNVTGGAVLVRTRAPSNELSANVKVGTTDDADTTVAASVSGPLIADRLSARLTTYYNDDEGWFTNRFDGRTYGGSTTLLVRPSVSWKPTGGSELIVRYEHGDVDGDNGAPGQNRALFRRDTFDFSVNYPGDNDGEWDQVIAELNIDVPFGNGAITNIFGWRDFLGTTAVDVDSTPNTLFHAETKVIQDQMSNELRYAGSFGRTSLTAGLYWFTQDLQYLERRLLANGAVVSTLGGVQDQTARGVFASADVSLSEAWILNLGVRYSVEEKSASVATFRQSTAGSACNFDQETCTFDPPLADVDDSDVTPKVGVQWRVREDAQLYASFSKGFRSGGYNLRSTSLTVPPGPTRSEKQDSFEVGGKASWLDSRLRTNIALFYNEVSNMQREVNLSDPGVAVVQIIRNTADATIKGAELEVQAVPVRSLLLSANVGYTDGEYDRLIFDISGDGRIDAADYALEIPRLAELTYGVSAIHELDIGAVGSLSTRIAFSHRDKAFFTDNNRGVLSPADMLDASLTLRLMDDALSIAVFGTNLMDEVTEGNETLLPETAPFGGRGATFAPLNKGRVLGIEVAYRL
jgi:iron complex outermembrane receptor protein